MVNKLHGSPSPICKSYHMKIPNTYRYHPQRFSIIRKMIRNLIDIHTLNTYKKRKLKYTSTSNIHGKNNYIRNLGYKLLILDLKLNKLWTLLNPKGTESTAGLRPGNSILPLFHRRSHSALILGTAGMIYKPYDRRIR